MQKGDRFFCLAVVPSGSVIGECGATLQEPAVSIGIANPMLLVEALRNGRKFIGTELKDSYFKTAAKNLRDAAVMSDAPLLSNAC